MPRNHWFLWTNKDNNGSDFNAAKETIHLQGLNGDLKVEANELIGIVQ
jgi:hypothetical protein